MLLSIPESFNIFFSEYIGPDHLAAVLPRCIGKRWWIASRIGAMWALGHGVSASLLGLFAFFLKGEFIIFIQQRIIFIRFELLR